MKYHMRKQISFLVLITFWGLTATGQNTQYVKASESDPEAKTILDKLRKKYDGYQSLEAAFKLEIELPEKDKEVQKGKIARQGAKYWLELPAQSVLSDGKALWMILHGNKEVQINDLPDPEETAGSLLTPESIFNFYQKGEFVYQLLNEYSKGGVVVQEVEFKPLDKNSEYAKLRMEVNKGKNEIMSVKAFARDGSRYTFSIEQFTPNKSFAANYFSFDKNKYQGYHLEDLRE